MNNDWLELEGKTVIVTGAASGIGKASCAGVFEYWGECSYF